MKKPGTRAGALLAAIWLLSASSAWADSGYIHAEEPIETVRHMYDGALTPDMAVNTFRNIDRLFPTRLVRHGDHVYPLPQADKQLAPPLKFTAGGKDWDLYDYLAINRVAALLVLKDGKIAYETYQYGNRPSTRWMSMSTAKSITSTLFGAALKDGLIKSLDDQVVTYVPALRGTAYDGVSIRNILMMASGVKWDETYTDPNSDRRHLLEAQLAQQPGGAMAIMAKLPRAAPPGEVNNYSTGETQVAGEVLHGALKRPLADYLTEKIWKPFGMESDATWWLDSPNGVEIAGSGFSATLRDYGRFGLFILNGGIAGGKELLPKGWIQEATTAKTLKSGKPLAYGYFWWPISATVDPQAPYSGSGIFGQSLYIDPKEKVVIVEWSARSKPGGRDIIDDKTFFKAVTTALH